MRQYIHILRFVLYGYVAELHFQFNQYIYKTERIHIAIGYVKILSPIVDAIWVMGRRRMAKLYPGNVYRSYFTCVVSESVKYTRRICFRTKDWNSFPGKAIIPGKYCVGCMAECWRCRAQYAGFSGKYDSSGKHRGVCSLVWYDYFNINSVQNWTNALYFMFPKFIWVRMEFDSFSFSFDEESFRAKKVRTRLFMFFFQLAN